MWQKAKTIGRLIGGLAVFAARAYVNYKYPGAKVAWVEARKAGVALPTDVDEYLDWFFKVS